jgi:SAM-dependent methyltransferase
VTSGRHPFADVDDQSDPDAWIGVLDRLRREPAYRAYKQRISELLNPTVGGRYLEVGVGTGADALDLIAEHECSVVGVDSSRTMVAEARRRGLVEVAAADAHSLPFSSSSFDGAYADRTFQHLARPATALAEMARVVRPGGTVVVADPDYGTQVVNIRDQELADRVLRFRAGVGHGRLAHQMSRLFAEAGLSDVRVEAMPIVVRDPAALDNALGLRDWARLAADARILRPDDAGRWESALDEAARGGWFLYSFSVFLTVGRR